MNLIYFLSVIRCLYLYMVGFFAESGPEIKLVEMPIYLAESKISITEKHLFVCLFAFYIFFLQSKKKKNKQ